MALAYNTSNYLYGKGRLYFKATGGSGYLDLGNVPKFELSIEPTKIAHYSSRSGLKEKDLELTTEIKVSSSLSLEEFSIENMNLAFWGDTVQASSQTAGYQIKTSTAVVQDLYVSLGKKNLSYVKLTHAGVTGTAFALDEVITGAAGSAGRVAWTTATTVELVDVTAAEAAGFVLGETITGGSGSGTAVISNIEKFTDDIVVCDAASATTRYTKGTHYDVDCKGGLLRKLATIVSPCFTSFDWAANTLKAVRALANSSATGELLFIGDPDQGPKLHIQCWTVNLSISGAVGLISDDVASIPLNCEILSAAGAHPTEPFFRITDVS